MSQPEVPLRDATAIDLDAILAFRAGAGWAAHGWAMRAQIGHPDSVFLVAEEGGQIVGMGSGIVYAPSLGFIGNMVVAESHRRRGIGSAILDAVVGRLSRAGCHRIELNATDDGRPLYERHGFASRGISTAAGISRRALRRLGSARPARPMEATDLDRVSAYDRPRFGGDRSRVLRLLATNRIARGYVVEGDDTLDGFAFIQRDDRRIGPLVADRPEAAAGLVTAIFEADSDLADVRLNLPPENVVGAGWLRGARVAVADWSGRMARGPDVTRRDDTIYQMTAGPLG